MINVLARFRAASTEFAQRLPFVRDWTAPTPCTEWNVRQLVNHMVRGNLNYVDLLAGGTRETSYACATPTPWAMTHSPPTPRRCS